MPPASWEAVKAQIEAELGAPIKELFASFEVELLAAASLAQVHGATLPDGRKVVVKVQRPDIEEVIAVDLEILFDFGVSQPYVRRFLWQMASPRVWGRKLAKGSGDWGELLTLFPRQATRLLDQVERGELGLTLSLKETDRVVGKLDRIANRLVVSTLFAALIVGMALLIPLVAEGGRGFVFWLVVAGFATASFMGLGLLYSI